MIYQVPYSLVGCPDGTSGKESTYQCRRSKRLTFNHWVGKILWSRKWKTTPVFLPGEFHAQRNLAGCSPWGRKELDGTEHTRIFTLVGGPQAGECLHCRDSPTGVRGLSFTSGSPAQGPCTGNISPQSIWL